MTLDSILTYMEHHAHWAPVIFGLMAFGESMVLIGILIPATTVMVACGALVGAGKLPLWPMWLAGAIGGSLGDAVSYFIGRWLGPEAHKHWPFTKYPAAMTKGEAMFRRWGWVAVFAGRFAGPIRAIIPLVAGIFGMRNSLFQFLNVTSAIVWVPTVILPGALGGWLYEQYSNGHKTLAIGLAIAALAVVALGWWAWRCHGHRLVPKEPPAP